MGFLVFVSPAIATNIEMQVSGFLFHLAGGLRAQAIDDVEPTIPTAETPTHSRFCLLAVSITKYVGITLAKMGVKFLAHHFLHPASHLGKLRYGDFGVQRNPPG